MDYLSGWCKSRNTLDGCTVIITGSNTGIGKETVLDLYKRGAHIVMACRNLKKAEEAKDDIIKETQDNQLKGSIAIETLDLNCLTSVRECASRILANEQKINILINNAGVMMCPEGRTVDGFETHIGINHFGHALFTLLLLPRLINSEPSRIITVASFAHILSNFDFDDINVEKYYNPVKAYARSKSANILFSKALHLKLREHNIQNVNTYSLHPGSVRTELGRYLDNSMAYGATWFFNNILGLFLRSPRCGAQTTIYCAVDNACKNESGLYYGDCGVSRTYWQCRDDESALKLWDLTIQKLNLTNYDIFHEINH